MKRIDAVGAVAIRRTNPQFTIHIDANSITFRVNGMAYDMWTCAPGDDHVLARAGRVHENMHRTGW